MPMFRQGSVGSVLAGDATDGWIPPKAGSRAGTTNPAAGLSIDVDASGYKSATLVSVAGVVAASTGAIAAKVQAATAAGGSYADVTGAAIAGFGPDDDNTIQTVDFYIPAGKPFLSIVHTQSQATDIGCSFLILHGPGRS